MKRVLPTHLPFQGSIFTIVKILALLLNADERVRRVSLYLSIYLFIYRFINTFIFLGIGVCMYGTKKDIYYIYADDAER